MSKNHLRVLFSVSTVWFQCWAAGELNWWNRGEDAAQFVFNFHFCFHVFVRAHAAFRCCGTGGVFCRYSIQVILKNWGWMFSLGRCRAPNTKIKISCKKKFDFRQSERSDFQFVLVSPEHSIRAWVSAWTTRWIPVPLIEPMFPLLVLIPPTYDARTWGNTFWLTWEALSSKPSCEGSTHKLSVVKRAC